MKPECGKRGQQHDLHWTVLSAGNLRGMECRSRQTVRESVENGEEPKQDNGSSRANVKNRKILRRSLLADGRVVSMMRKSSERETVDRNKQASTHRSVESQLSS